jgi:chromosome segregation ATPase
VPAPPARAAPPAPPPPAAPSAPRQRDADPGEAARLQDRISELRLEAARVTEERERLAARLAVAERERDEARARAGELEAIVAKHEARVVKAYERLKGDEAVKEKTRRALAIALQLLEEGAAPPKTREG